MIMPPRSDNTSTNNGIHQYENALTIGTVELIENQIVLDEINDFAENDFSEYYWMENLEEFDKEVMEKLEEEALMEECLEAFREEEEAEKEDCLMANVSPVVQYSSLNPEAAEFVPLNNRTMTLVYPE